MSGHNSRRDHPHHPFSSFANRHMGGRNNHHDHTTHPCRRPYIRLHTPKVRQLLQTAQQARLTADQSTIFNQWMARRHQFHIETTQLLTVQSSAKLDQLLDTAGLRRHVFQRISPRHAIVSRQLTAPLQKWLAKQNIPLTHPVAQRSVAYDDPGEQAYLALCVLDQLNRILPQAQLNLPPTLAVMAQQFSAETQSEIEHRASQIIAELRHVIEGYDTQPLPPPPCPATHDHIATSDCRPTTTPDPLFASHTGNTSLPHHHTRVDRNQKVTTIPARPVSPGECNPHIPH